MIQQCQPHTKTSSNFRHRLILWNEDCSRNLKALTMPRADDALRYSTDPIGKLRRIMVFTSYSKIVVSRPAMEGTCE